MRHIPLEELEVFVAFAESGSLAAAARALNKAPSAMTAAMQSIEAKLGLTLCDRSGYRVTPSEHGRELLPRAQQILRDLSGWQSIARALATGLESEVIISVDAMFPMERAIDVLALFAQRFPDTVLTMRVAPSASAERLMMKETAALGLLVDFQPRAEDVIIYPVQPVQLMPVCARQHPLAQSYKRLSVADVRDHRQIVLSDGDRNFDEWGTRGICAQKIWRVTDLSTKRLLILSGQGWGSLPDHIARPDLANGTLSLLDMLEWGVHPAPPTLGAAIVHRRNSALGPATSWLCDALKSTLVRSDQAPLTAHQMRAEYLQFDP